MKKITNKSNCVMSYARNASKKLEYAQIILFELLMKLTGKETNGVHFYSSNSIILLENF